MIGAGASSPLGPLLVLTDRTLCRRPLAQVVGAAVEGGALTVVLREKDLPDAGRAELAEQLRALVEPVGGRLVVAGPPLPQAAADRACDAVHLTAVDALPVPRPPLVGRSCHDPASVRRAAAEGCDWVTVSPVRATASKPGYGPALGLDGLAATTDCGVPVYALGGLTPDDAAACLSAGAAGIAVMGAVMRADRPDRVVANLLAALRPDRSVADGSPR